MTSEIEPNGGVAPVPVEGEIEAKADLIKLGTAVNGANTPHAAKSPPGVALVVFGKLDETSAAAALKSLATVQGVDSKGSKADIKKGQISVKLSGADGDYNDVEEGAKLSIADILAVLKEAGVEASISET